MRTRTRANFRIFTRTWWKEAETPGWPNNLEPQAGERTYIGKADTEDEARAICRAWNKANDPGRYSLKAEYEEA